MVVFRAHAAGSAAQLGCTIDPRRENLARVQEFWKSPEPDGNPGGRPPRRVERLRSVLGKQDIEVCGGLDTHTHAARVMVEADYRMGSRRGCRIERARPVSSPISS